MPMRKNRLREPSVTHWENAVRNATHRSMDKVDFEMSDNII